MASTWFRQYGYNVDSSILQQRSFLNIVTIYQYCLFNMTAICHCAMELASFNAAAMRFGITTGCMPRGAKQGVASAAIHFGFPSQFNFHTQRASQSCCALKPMAATLQKNTGAIKQCQIAALLQKRHLYVPAILRKLRRNIKKNWGRSSN